MQRYATVAGCDKPVKRILSPDVHRMIAIDCQLAVHYSLISTPMLLRVQHVQRERNQVAFIVPAVQLACVCCHVPMSLSVLDYL